MIIRRSVNTYDVTSCFVRNKTVLGSFLLIIASSELGQVSVVVALPVNKSN